MTKFFSDGYGSGLLSGLASTISGIWATHQQNKNVDKQIAAARQENAEARDYNLRLAKLQNAWNVAQWRRENEYNSPQSVMGRFRSAGLNPDLIYGGASNLGSASSPSLTAGAPASPVDVSAIGQKRTIGDAVQQGLRDSLLGAQVQLMNAQAKKTENEAKGQEITNSNLFEMDRAQIEKILSDTELSKKQVDEVAANVEVLKSKVDEVRENILTLKQLRQNSSEQQTLNWLDYELRRQRNAWQNRLDGSQLRLLDQQWAQSKKLFFQIYKSAEVEANMSNQLWQDYLAGKEHYSSQMFGGLPNWLKGTIYFFDVVSGIFTPASQIFSNFRGKTVIKR